MPKEKNIYKKIIILVILLIAALLSTNVISKYATSPEFHASTIEVLEEKKMTAMKLTAAVAVTSTAISALPGDSATPIAEQVSELTGPLFIVVCAIYLEKFLLTTIGYLSFNVLIPIACVLAGIYVFCRKEMLRSFVIKLVIFAIAIYGIVPVSVKVMDLIETTFKESISQTYEQVDIIADEAKDSSEEEDSNAFLDFLTSIGDGVTGLVDRAKNALGVFIDAIAVLIITTCVIPIAVLLFFVWIIKMILGLDMSMPGMKKWHHLTKS